jgi:hypothetical protein
MTRKNLQEQLLSLIQTWPILIGVILISSLAGWGVMHLRPPQTAASADLYIGLQVDRILDISSVAQYAKTEPMNIDDFKNWQLSQFEAVASSDETAELVLQSLEDQQADPGNLTADGFQKQSSLAWYDAGRWKLSYRSQDSEFALQAVQTWRDVVQEQISQYLIQAEQAYALDGDLRALDGEIAALQTRVLKLENLEDVLGEFTRNLEAQPSGSSLQSDPRQDLLTAVRSSAAQESFGALILADFPPEGASVSTYLGWIQQAEESARTQREHSQNLIQDLEEQSDRVRHQYLDKVKSARGFSPALVVEELDPEPQLHTSYPDGLVILASGLIGVLLYLIYTFSKASFRDEQ